MQDGLGDRMKANYEDRYRYLLSRRAYTIIRIDGKAFHTYTRGLERPFDDLLMNDMNATAAYVCKNIQGAKVAYVQSDEISVLLTDFDDIKTEAWFDNNLQKMCSVSASLATSIFNFQRKDCIPFKLAQFDSRIFQIPNKSEVENYFIWRQQDAVRNSISAIAQSMYSSKELNKKSTNEMQEMIFQKGMNWNAYTNDKKRGRMVMKFNKNPFPDKPEVIRTIWEASEVPIFTQEREYLRNIIPDNN